MSEANVSEFMPFFSPGLTVFRDFGSEVISLTPLLVGDAGFYTNNLDVAKQVISGAHKTSFIKPERASRALL